MLEITDVKIRKFDKEGSKLKAFAKITIDNSFVVDGLKVINGAKGLFVGFPSRKSGEEYVDIAYPISKEARNLISEKIISAYKNKPSDSDEDLFE